MRGDIFALERMEMQIKETGYGRQELDRALMVTKAWPSWARYVAAVIVVCGVGYLWSHFNVDRPFLLFFPAIVLCAVLLNRGSGYVATVTAALYCAIFLLPSNGELASRDTAALIIFILVGLGIAALVEKLRERLLELREAEERASVLAMERQLLVDELAHRTRNDFTNVVTLLNLQAAASEDSARDAFKAVADRVRTIARVHRRLHVTDKRVVVDSREFLLELCDDLRFFRVAERPIQIQIAVESHMISLEKAVPLGLIVNELVTNATKHAFPDDRTGKILVSFKRNGGFYELCVEDDGVGISGSKPGLGTRLLRLLAGQLGSTYELGPSVLGGARAVINIRVRTES